MTPAATEDRGARPGKQHEMKRQRWMIYGANGYTAALALAMAVDHWQRPVLAGRNEAAVATVAARYGLKYRVFDLDNEVKLESAISDMDAVLNMAGPFSATAEPMVKACLKKGTHYLDVTGEIDVLEAVLSRDAEARDQGVCLLPGVGFDVVPTDCMAALLAGQLPDAHYLELAIGGGKPSPGTVKTLIEGMAKGGAARIAGKITPVPAAWKTRDIPFADGVSPAVSIPWGDVATAYHSTGIPNIVTYVRAGQKDAARLRHLDTLRPFMKLKGVQSACKHLAGKWVKGPDELQRTIGQSQVFGQVSNPEGRFVSATMTTPEAYAFTAQSSVMAMLAVLEDRVAFGAHTPSKALGPRFVLDLRGVAMSPFVWGDKASAPLRERTR